MSVELRYGDGRFFEQRSQHDRRARVDRLVPAGNLSQDRLHALEIGCHDFQDVAILTGHVMTLEDAGILFHLLDAGFVTEIVRIAVTDTDERGDGIAGLAAIDASAVPGDEAAL